MQLSQYQLRRFVNEESGSSVVGFALIVPLVVGVFFAVIQIANLVNVKTAIQAAANSGARIASRYDGTLMAGQNEATIQLAMQGITNDLLVIPSHLTESGITYTQVRIEHSYVIPWVGVTLNLTSIGKAVDEKWL